MLTTISAVVGGAIYEYLTSGLNAGADSNLHASFMKYLRSIIAAAQSI